MEREIGRLKKQILTLSAQVEDNVQKAVDSLHQRNEVLAREVHEADLIVDRMEVEVEEECLKILALHQPVAIDLRYVVSILKINNDLERIGDLAANIADKAIFLSAKDPLAMAVDFHRMAEVTQDMLRQALDALVNMDAPAAREVCARDDEVDAMKHEVRQTVEAEMKKTPERVPSLMSVMGVARNLERIADLATNISEDVIYMIAGEIIRHRDAV
jgi:phosphate transport system protein